MWRDVASFDGHVLVVDVELKSCLNLCLSCFEYQKQTNTFVAKTHQRQIFKYLPNDRRIFKIHCLGFKVLLDHHCGIFLPYLVAQLNTDLCQLFCFESDTRKWSVKYCFEVPEVSGQTMQFDSFADCSIRNGPTVIWIVKELLFIYKAEYSFTNSASCVLKLSIDHMADMQQTVTLSSDNNGKILWWTDSFYPNDCEQGLLAIKKGESTPSSYLVTLDKEDRTSSIVFTANVIPPVYLAVTTCSCTLHQNLVINRKNSAVVPYRVFISTTHGQLVEFCEGQYVKHVNIPLSCCQNIGTLESYTGDLILLCSQDSQICAVDWSSSKILRNWSQFQNILIDDFIGIGIDQVLLFSGNSKGQPEIFDEFILSDFVGADLSKTREQKREEMVAVSDYDVQKDANSMDKIVHALIRKLKATEESLTECKIEKSEKSSFVKKHCRVLHDIAMNRNRALSAQSSSLACLLVGSKSCTTEGRESDYANLAVISKWHDVCTSEWIVAVEVQNVGKRTVSDISLSLISKRKGLLSSHSFTSQYPEIHQGNEEHGMSSNNQSTLAPDQKLTITTTSGLPDFAFSREFSVGLMLSWKLNKEEYRFAHYCGEITISVDDVLNHQTRDVFAESHSCQYHDHSFLETKFMVSTRYTSISDAKELLKSNMNFCHYHRDVLSPCCSTYHLRPSTLSSVHVRFTNAKNDFIISILASDHSQLILALYLLKRYLPDSVRWHAVRSQKLVDYAVKCVEDEVISVRKKLQHLLNIQSDKYTIPVEVSLTSEKSEDISVKRRKLSKTKDNVHRQFDETVDWDDGFTTFRNICYHLCKTEKAFQGFFLMYEPAV